MSESSASRIMDNLEGSKKPRNIILNRKFGFAKSVNWKYFLNSHKNFCFKNKFLTKIKLVI